MSIHSFLAATSAAVLLGVAFASPASAHNHAEEEEATLPFGAKFIPTCNSALPPALIRTDVKGSMRLVETREPGATGAVRVELAVEVSPRLRAMALTQDLQCGRLDLDVTLHLRDFVLGVSADYPPDSCEARQIVAREEARVTRVLREAEALRNHLEAAMLARYEKRVYFLPKGQEFDASAVVRRVTSEAKARWEAAWAKLIAAPEPWTRGQLEAVCSRR